MPEGPFLLLPGRILLLALCFGLWKGIIETLPVLVSLKGGGLIRLSRDFLWMTPLADVILFLSAGIIVLAAGRRWPWLTTRHAVMSLFAGMATMAVALSAERLYAVAALLLAVGVAVQVGRRTRTAIRHSKVLPISAGVALLFVVVPATRVELRDRWIHQYWLDQMPGPQAESPNIVLLILDTVRGASLGFLEDLQWSMFTGHWANRLSGPVGPGVEASTGLDPGMTTVAEVLRDSGYLTAGFVGNLLYAFAETGLGLGFLTYEDYEVSPAQIFLSCSVGRRLARADWLRSMVKQHEVLNRKDARTVMNQFLDLAGLDAAQTSIQGRSLARYWSQPEDGLGGSAGPPSETAFSVLYRGAMTEAWYPVERGPAMYSLVDSVYHYILNGDGTEELYDLGVDPKESSDLARQPSHGDILEDFRERLREFAPEASGGVRR